MKDKILFLDDVRMPVDAFHYMKMKIFSREDWEIVRNYDEFIDWIQVNGLPDFIAFDHDLADEHYDVSMYYGVEAYNERAVTFKEKTGMDCAVWLVDYCMDNGFEFPEYIVHSMNPAGKQNIISYIENFKKHG